MSLILLSSKTFQVIFIRQKKILLFPEMRVTRKIFARAVANLFFLNLFSGNILFSSLVSFVVVFWGFFCILVFFCCCFCLFVYFLKLKVYILIHVAYERQKHFHPADFRKQNYFFFGLSGAIIDRKESKDPTWYKNFVNSSCIDLLLTKSGKNTTGTCTIETSISNF